MNEKIEVEVFYRDSGVLILQRPDRGYPSLAIQGDKLALLATRLQSAEERIKAGQWDEEIEYDLEFVRETLSSLWAVYQEYGLRPGLFDSQNQPK